MWVCLAFLLSICQGAGLIADPIVGAQTKYLDGEWTLTSGKTNIKANVPGNLDLATS